MRDLMEIRQQIDQIDQKMLALFKERMGCSAEVAEYKRGTGKAIYDPARERQKIDALTKDENEMIIKKSVEEMFLQMMSISRRYQYSLLSQEDTYIDGMFDVTPFEGVIAETAGAFTLYLTEYLKIPVSTTHTITGAIIGVGATKRLSAVRWGVTRSLMTAWVLTIPVSALLAAAVYWGVTL